MTEIYHVPVLFEESLDALVSSPTGTYVDLTFGGGGHSAGVLQRLSQGGRLIAFDQDRDTQGHLPQDSRFLFVEGNFRFLRNWLRYHGIEQVDGIFADLGVSSHHFDTAERGFSFRFDAPLDMRMNQRARLSAVEVVNGYDHVRLTALLRDYGELEAPHKVTQCIERARSIAPITTIQQLIDAVAPVTPRSGESKFLAKLFQAIRIEVNGEMEALRMMLEQSLKVLSAGGRLVVITYHSLEDRLVKNFLRSGNFEGRVEKDFFGRPHLPFQIVTRRAITPSPAELERNPRSRSAKLRVAIRNEQSER